MVGVAVSMGMARNPPVRARDYPLRVWITQDERDRLEADAKAAGMTMSDYVRSRVLPGTERGLSARKG